LQVVLLAICPL